MYCFLFAGKNYWYLCRWQSGQFPTSIVSNLDFDMELHVSFAKELYTITIYVFALHKLSNIDLEK